MDCIHVKKLFRSSPISADGMSLSLIYTPLAGLLGGISRRFPSCNLFKAATSFSMEPHAPSKAVSVLCCFLPCCGFDNEDLLLPDCFGMMIRKGLVTARLPREGTGKAYVGVQHSGTTIGPCTLYGSSTQLPTVTILCNLDLDST